MHEHIRQNKHETVLIAQEELHDQKSSHILRVNHNSAGAITKINLYLCGYLIYIIEKQILSGSKFYISLHLCRSPHLFQTNRICPLSTSPPCTGLEWSEKNNYSRIVTVVSMQRQTSVLNRVIEHYFCAWGKAENMSLADMKLICLNWEVLWIFHKIRYLTAMIFQ